MNVYRRIENLLRGLSLGEKRDWTVGSSRVNTEDVFDLSIVKLIYRQKNLLQWLVGEENTGIWFRRSSWKAMVKTALWCLLNHCREESKSSEDLGQSEKVCFMESSWLHITHFSSFVIPKVFNSFLVSRTRWSNLTRTTGACYRG